MAMKYACMKSGIEVSAEDLSYGTIRSNQYFCIFCGKHVSYVNGNEKRIAHFRHAKDDSCITNSSKKEVEEQAASRISNRKTQFHTWWQGLFNKDYIEVPFSQGKTNHVADIYLKSDCDIQVKLDNGSNLFEHASKSLVIEVQHSVISVRDAQSRNETYTSNGNLLWIVDVSHIKFKVDRFITSSQDSIRILFPDTQHRGLVNIITANKNSVILLDTGKYLYKVVHTHFDHGYVHVETISKIGLVKQLMDQGIDIDLQKCSNDYYTSEPTIHATRNYKTFIEALDLRIHIDIDHILNMIEDMPVTQLRKILERSNIERYENYVEMITSWLGYKSNSNPIVLKLLNTWIEHIKETFYVKDHLTFGKYAYISLYKLPQHYLKWALENEIVRDKELEDKLLELRTMDRCFINHTFNNPGKLWHYNNACDAYWEWDKRTLDQRKMLLPSLLQRPWIYMIDEVKPDIDGKVCTSSDYLSKCSNETPSYLYPEPIYNETLFDDFYKFTPICVNGRYLGISEEDLLDNYILFDAHYAITVLKPWKKEKDKKGVYKFVDIDND